MGTLFSKSSNHEALIVPAMSAEMDRVAVNDAAIAEIETAATAPTFAASLALDGVKPSSTPEE